MPLYEYRCGQCGAVSEVLVRRPDSAPTCPNCGAGDLERLYSVSYLIRADTGRQGGTCCGRETPCDAPPCSTGDGCRRR